MSRHLVALNSETDRLLVTRYVSAAPLGTRVEFKSAKRSLDQNSKLWAMLSDVSRQVVWHGQKLTPDDWKDMFTASLRKARVVPGIDAGTFAIIGLHTSDMSKEEFSNLLELIAAFGAEHGVKFSDDRERAA